MLVYFLLFALLLLCIGTLMHHLKMVEAFRHRLFNIDARIQALSLDEQMGRNSSDVRLNRLEQKVL
ncbi:hypothetical protein [Alcaligenes endophyticus]|uniref:Uncharacterized protein n=1 Tax=Alcaligenes endophyticus TaxID=1929088 RepID=A0ABT8EJ00_9BURK|nr:hypothetical protein [Alcaligenes endophyticus]MCX5592537.1 hypothetical protein [Alcaligenes endophyticus]MDN4121263.1 hypothetical protein [Alcaligenes endophyticus]